MALAPGKRQVDLLLASATRCPSACKLRCWGGLAVGQEWPGETSWPWAEPGKQGSGVFCCLAPCLHPHRSPGAAGRKVPRCSVALGRSAHPPPAARSQQVKVDPEKLWLALVDGACASPSPLGESKVLSGGGGQEPPEQVKHERLTGKGHGEF